MTTVIWFAIIPLLIATSSIVPTTIGYAQVSPTTSEGIPEELQAMMRNLDQPYLEQINASQLARGIIDAVRNECQAVGLDGFFCVRLIYESPKTVLLEGQLLVENLTGGADAGATQNPYFWKAVDGFKDQGYTITTVELSGQGSVGNPHEWLVVMSK
jgi:hypothetical protein